MPRHRWRKHNPPADIFRYVLQARQTGNPDRRRWSKIPDLTVFVCIIGGFHAEIDTDAAMFERWRTAFYRFQYPSGRFDADQGDGILSNKPQNAPIAFEPPPIQAITASGRRPSRREGSARGLPITNHTLELADNGRVRDAGLPQRLQIVGRGLVLLRSSRAAPQYRHSAWRAAVHRNDLPRPSTACGTHLRLTFHVFLPLYTPAFLRPSSALASAAATPR